MEILSRQRLEAISKATNARKPFIGLGDLRSSGASGGDYACISDHHMVLASFDIGIPEATVVMRTVFDSKEADWASIKHDIAVFDWTVVDNASVGEAKHYLHNSLFHILRIHIPERSFCDRKSVRP